MARIIFRDQDPQSLHARAEELAAQTAAALHSCGEGQVQMKGPMPCAVNRIAGYWRDQIVLLSAAPRALQRVLAAVRAGGRLTRAEHVAVDVDPVSLL
jgi:primosomal protein N' (replication factor Y) (superfamily II helicase)